MSSVNKVILIGNLGKDPEIKPSPPVVAFATQALPQLKPGKTKTGSKGEETTWHDLEIWDKQADNFHKYLKKGSKVYVEGLIKKNKNEETGVWYTKVKVNTSQFMDSKGSQSGDSTPSQEPAFAEDDIRSRRQSWKS